MIQSIISPSAKHNLTSHSFTEITNVLFRHFIYKLTEKHNQVGETVRIRPFSW